MASDPTQEALLAEFKDRIRPLLTPKFKDDSDGSLMKWLTVKHMNVDRAVEAFRNHMEWREKYAVDDLPESYRPPEVIAKYHVGGYLGSDRGNHPVLFLPFTLADLRGIRKATTTSKPWILHAVNLLEEGKSRCRQNTEHMGKSVDRITVVFDILNLPLSLYLWRPFFEVVFFIIRTFEDHYPEFLNKAIIFNSPRLFSVALKMVGQTLRVSTSERIHVYGTDNTEWVRAILLEMEPDIWPSHWGGAKIVDSDPKCSKILGKGGLVPFEMYPEPLDQDPPSELVSEFRERAGPLIRDRLDTITGPVVRERLETIAGNLLSERLFNDTGVIIREFFQTRVGPVTTERIQTVAGPLLRERLETTAGTLLRETLNTENGPRVRERLEAATARIGRHVDEQLSRVANELATTADLLSRRFDNEEVFHIPKEFKLIYPVKIEEPGAILRWVYLLEATDIDFVLKYSPDMERSLAKQVRQALEFDPNGPDEGRLEIVMPRTRIFGTTDPTEDAVLCQKAGIYILEFSNAYSRRESKVLHIAVDIEPPPKPPQPQKRNSVTEHTQTDPQPPPGEPPDGRADAT